ncbi:MAG: hypothetical protein PHH64_03010 [Proteiniphilum sp.]|nr:hypothetical protein [Proteiniphilum sp.]MDD4800286.1 hypothetical protein [Proteiniphilum sp.]
MDNDALKTILELQRENTIYERAINGTIGIVNGSINNTPECGIEDVDVSVLMQSVSAIVNARRLALY